MGEKKKENLPVLSVLAIVVPIAAVVIAPAVAMYGKQNVVITTLENIGEKQDTHFESSAKHEEKQDKRIDENADAIKDNGFKISQLGPAGETAEVNRVIALVQDAIDCKEVSDDQTEWICVPAASSDYLPDDLRSRVEEHFRKLGYEVSRQRQLPGGQWRGFWILVEQS